MTKLKCGIIGCGRVAWKFDGGRWDGKRSFTHSSCIDRHPNTSLIAMYEPNTKVHKDILDNHPRGKLLTITDKLDKFFECELDLVSITSPSEFHKEHILKSIKRKIPLLWIEKPVTLDMSSFREIQKKLNDLNYKNRNIVNYFRRFLPQYEFLKKKIINSKIIRSIELNYSQSLSVNGVHLLDILGFFFPKETPPKIRWFSDFNSGNPSFGFKLSGADVFVLGQNVPYHTIDVKVTTDKGRFSVLRGGLNVFEESSISNDKFDGFFHLSKPKDITKKVVINKFLEDGYYLSLCNLIDKKRKLQSSIETSFFSQNILEQVNLHYGIQKSK